MRKVRYSVAMSLDGYIAGPGGEYDWIVSDPEIDFQALMAEFDTVLMGRRTFAVALAQGSGGGMAGMRNLVFSRTLAASEHPGVTIIGDDAAGVVRTLREEEGKDIWLMGGGELFASLLAAGLVDAVEVAVVPVLLGGGVPMLPATAARTTLRLTGTRQYPSGIVTLRYEVAARAA